LGELFNPNPSPDFVRVDIYVLNKKIKYLGRITFGDPVLGGASTQILPDEVRVGFFISKPLQK